MSKMKQYTVTRPITISSGRVKLTDEQHKNRTLFVKRVGKKGNVYDVARPFQFKAGESFEYDGEIPKTFLDAVESDETETPSGEGSETDDTGGEDSEMGDPDNEETEAHSESTEPPVA